MKIYTTGRQNKKDNTNKKQRNKQGRTILVCLAWLVLWQLLSMAVGSELLLPSPHESLRALGRLAVTGDFYRDIAWTMLRCVIAMLLSIAAGGIAAWFASQSEAVRSFLSLPVSFFKAVPVMAVIIYVILLASADWVAIIVCFIMCFPIVYTNILSGLDSVNGEYLELAKLCRLSKGQTMRLVYFPSIRPNFNAALRLVCGLSWKAVIAAEVLSIPKFSLGYEMLNAKYYLETANLFAYIAVIVAMSIVFEKLICGLFAKEDRVSIAAIGARGRAGSKARKAADGRTPETAAGCTAAGGILPPAVRLEHLSKSFEEKSVLDDLTLSLSAGSVTAIAAPSGRGKTTIARLIAGLEKADSGSVVFAFPSSAAGVCGRVEQHRADVCDCGKVKHCDAAAAAACGEPSVYTEPFTQDTQAALGNTDINAAEFACGEAKECGSYTQATVESAAAANGRVSISYLFQEDRLLPWLNVYDNMALARINDAACGLDTEIRSMAEALELSEALDKMPAELSGGMKHRAALGRTFLAESNLMILDEPFRGLDKELKERIAARLWGKVVQGKTVLLISHNEEDCEKLAKEVIRI